MRAYYRLVLLNVAFTLPFIWHKWFRVHRAIGWLYLGALFALPFVNYAITRRIARQRGTFSLELGLWLVWVGGPLATAMFVLFVFVINQNFGDSLGSALFYAWMAYSAWKVVREAEQQGWGKIDPRGPRTLTEALRR